MSLMKHFLNHAHEVRLPAAHSVGAGIPSTVASSIHAHAPGATDLFHKILSLVFSVAVVLGIYGAFSPQFRTFALLDITDRYRAAVAFSDASTRFLNEANAAVLEEWKNGDPLQYGVAAVAQTLMR